MALFQQGKSYLWMFPIFGVLFFGGVALCVQTVGNPGWGILTLPGFLMFVLGAEIRSGVALDSWWRATYPRGTSRYRALLLWQAVVTVLATAMAVFSIYSFSRGDFAGRMPPNPL
jgi:membrane-bound ClpP family serine protease